MGCKVGPERIIDEQTTPVAERTVVVNCCCDVHNAKRPVSNACARIQLSLFTSPAVVKGRGGACSLRSVFKLKNLNLIPTCV